MDSHQHAAETPTTLRLWSLAALVAGLALFASGLWWQSGHNPNLSFLPSRSPARWIIYPNPAASVPFWAIDLSTEFRRSFVVTNPTTATISLCAWKRAVLNINGKPISTSSNVKNWKITASLDVTLQPGTNEVSVTVFNDMGPPALWLSLKASDTTLISDESWQCSFVGASWRPAQLASTPLPIRPGNLLYGRERVWPSLRSQLPVLTLFLGLSFVICIMFKVLHRRFLSTSQKVGPSLSLKPVASLDPGAWLLVLSRHPASLLFIALVIAWFSLWSNNLGYLPFVHGFDVEEHMKYVDYILTRHRLPLANEGFQMYQPPLYYLVSAGLLSLFQASTFDANGIFILRLLGLVCGIATFTFAFLTGRLLFPGCQRKQLFCLLLAGCLAPNLYLCQYITNEILSTAMAAACAYACLRALARDGVSLREHAGVGLLLGAAMLAKTSAIVMPPLIFSVLAWNLFCKKPRNPKVWVGYLALVGICFLAVCGWHYARVAAKFGNPFIANVDPASGFHFWQPPGFRTLSSYMPKFESLNNPFFSGFSNVPDALYSTLWGDGLFGGRVEVGYRPPWNYHLMAAGYLFSLLPTAAILLGVIIVIRRLLRTSAWSPGFNRNDSDLRDEAKPQAHLSPAIQSLLLGLIALYALLLFYFSLKVPAYSAPKAFYGSGALIALCALGAIGWGLIIERAHRFRLLLYCALGVWALASFTSFWIQPEGLRTQLVIAQGFSVRGRHDLATNRLAQVLVRYPNNPDAERFLTTELLWVEQPSAAHALAEDQLRRNPLDGRAHLAMAIALVAQHRVEEGVLEAQRATQLAPDHPTGWQDLAEWLNFLGRNQEALAACREALRVSPSKASTHTLLATIATALNDPALAEVHTRLAADLK